MKEEKIIIVDKGVDESDNNSEACCVGAIIPIGI